MSGRVWCQVLSGALAALAGMLPLSAQAQPDTGKVVLVCEAV
jgi:ABC-type uncharacterized transport system permease subunit